jgi:hypothetical protein
MIRTIFGGDFGFVAADDSAAMADVKSESREQTASVRRWVSVIIFRC